MPAENSLRLDNEERLPPVLKLAGKQDEEAALRASEVRAVDRTVEDDELLAQEEVLSHQLGFTASEVSDSTERGAMRDRLGRARDGGADGLQSSFNERLDPFQDLEHYLLCLSSEF